MASATTKFQLTLPCALASVSPGLAALHASRAHRAHDVDITYNPPRCPRCGASFLHGAGSIRIIRRTKTKRSQHATALPRPASRFLRYSCSICGNDEDIAVNSSSADVLAIPQPRKRKGGDQRVPHMSSPTSSVRIEKKSKIDPFSAQPAVRQAPVPMPVPPAARSPAPLSSNKPPDAAPKDLPARGKARPKTKSGLQALLAKNREKQEQTRQPNSGGLSSFLQGL